MRDFNFLSWLGLAAVSVCGFAGPADAASTQLSIIVGGAASTSVACAVSTTLTAPVAAGTVICPIAVVPSGWTGVFTLSGANAASFALSGSTLVVGASPLAAGSYSVTITATP